jgi:hypothetical protein
MAFSICGTAARKALDFNHILPSLKLIIGLLTVKDAALSVRLLDRAFGGEVWRNDGRRGADMV